MNTGNESVLAKKNANPRRLAAESVYNFIGSVSKVGD